MTCMKSATMVRRLGLFGKWWADKLIRGGARDGRRGRRGKWQRFGCRQVDALVSYYHRFFIMVRYSRRQRWPMMSQFVNACMLITKMYSQVVRAASLRTALSIFVFLHDLLVWLLKHSNHTLPLCSCVCTCVRHILIEVALLFVLVAASTMCADLPQWNLALLILQLRTQGLF